MSRSRFLYGLLLVAAVSFAAVLLRAQAPPMLVLKTPHPEVVAAVAAAFDVDLDMYPAAAGRHYELTCASRGKCRVTTEHGDIGYLSLRAAPAALAKEFAEEIKTVQPLVQAGLMVGLQQHGFAAKEVGAFLKELWAFPQQLHRLSLRIDGDPTDHVAGFTLAVEVEPAPDGYLARIANALDPTPPGVPVLPTRDAVIALRVSLAPSSLPTVLTPFAELGLRITHQGEERLQQARAINERWMKAYDGSLAMTFGKDMRGQSLIGVRDPEALEVLLRGDDYRTLLETQRLPGQEFEMEVTPDALEHRGCKWLRMIMTYAEPNPLMPEGVYVTHAGGVGSYMGTVMGGDPAAAKALIDMVQEGKIVREPLADGAIVQLAVDLEALLTMGRELTGMRTGLGEKGGRHLEMTLARHGRALHLIGKLR